jgi:PAS domain S-box-containing protein
VPPDPQTQLPPDSEAGLRRELERSQQRLADCHRRMEQMEGFFHHIAEAVFIAEPDGVIVDANPAAVALTGYSVTELKGMRPWDLVVCADKEEIQAHLASATAGEARTVWRTLRCQNGVIKEVSLRLARGHFGGRELVICSCRDVTEQRATQTSLESALREMEDLKEQFQLATHTTPGLIWSAMPDGHVDFLNQRWLSYTGLSMEEAAGWGWAAAVHSDDLLQLEGYWRAMLVSGKAGEMECRLRRHDGVYRWFLFRGVPLHDASGTLVKWYGQTTDIDDRKRAETMLNSEKRMLEMIARGDDLAAVLERLCEMMEEAFPSTLCSILLYEESTQKLWHATSSRLPGALVKAVDGALVGAETGPCGRAVHFQQQIVVADIETDPFGCLYRDAALGSGLRSCWSSPILASNGRVLGTFASYTRKPGWPTPREQRLAEQCAHLASIAIERKQAADDLRASEQRRASAVIEERNRMARDIHDTLAQGFTGVIIQLEAAADARGQHLEDEADRHIARASELARESLAEARRSVRALRPLALETRPLVDALAELFQKMTSGTGVQARLHVEGTPRGLPSGWDENLLRIGQEVLTNTLRHAGATEFESRLTFGAESVQFLLRDNGRGFDLLARHDGFGLVGIHERAATLGGTVAVEGGPGNGTRVVIVLPCGKNAE